MRPLTLKPYKTPREGASWCLDIPEYLSETGKRQRKFFGTQKEAETAAEILKARRANFGNTLSLLSPERITEAAEVYKLLDSAESHFSLLEVVKSHLRQEKARSASRSFAHLFDLYLADRSEISEEHRYKLGKTKERFPKLRNKMACDITYEDLEPTLHKLKPHMRNAEMRNLNSIFRFGRKRRWLEINPIDQLSFVKIHRKEVETIAASTVEKILLDSLQNDRELLPFLVLARFQNKRTSIYRLE